MKRRFRAAATESASLSASDASQQGMPSLFIDHLIEQSVESALLYNEFSVLKVRLLSVLAIRAIMLTR
jgi:hypothetical protein